jgi:hypothetical protein
MLSPDELVTWDSQGYLIMDKLFTLEQLDTLDKVHRTCWWGKFERAFVLNRTTNVHKPMRDVTEFERNSHHLKINDLFFESSELRHCALNPDLRAVLTEALREPPVLAGSISMTYGSEQDDHVDYPFYSPTKDNVIAVWVALEQAVQTAGPFAFYPGSHLIPEYTYYSDLSREGINARIRAWSHYMNDELARLSLTSRQFLARRGEALIYHGALVHRGDPILDPTITRTNYIFHFIRESHCKQRRLQMLEQDGGLWLGVGAGTHVAEAL